MTSPKKKLIAGCAVIASMTLYVEHKLETKRYPMKLEYTLISNCMDNHFSSNTSKLLEVCTCSIEKSIQEIPLSELKDNPNRFSSVFRTSYKKCQ